MESKKELYEKVMHYAHLLEDSLGYDETKEGERWGQLVNQLQDFEFDQPEPIAKETKVCFFVTTYPAEEQDEQPHKEVLAVLLDNSTEIFNCYSSLGQHSTCSIEFLNQQCKKASPKQYKELQKEMENLGYNLEIVN